MVHLADIFESTGPTLTTFLHKGLTALTVFFQNFVFIKITTYKNLTKFTINV